MNLDNLVESYSRVYIRSTTQILKDQERRPVVDTLKIGNEASEHFNDTEVPSRE